MSKSTSNQDSPQTLEQKLKDYSKVYETSRLILHNYRRHENRIKRLIRARANVYKAFNR